MSRSTALIVTLIGLSITIAFGTMMGLSGGNIHAPKVVNINEIYGITVIVVDGCEYIVNPNYKNSLCYIAHKGNCTNSIHIYNK